MALFFTFCFIVLLGLFSQAQTLRYQKEEVALTLAQKNGIGPSPCMDIERLGELKTQDRKETSSKSPPKSSTKKQAPIRYRAGINLYHLLSKEETPLIDELFIKLFDQLYDQADFYRLELGKHFLAQLKVKATAKSSEKKGKTYLKNLEDLASLDLEHTELQKVLYQVLKGCENPYGRGGFPSLFNYLVLEHYSRSKINLYEVEHELLVSLFDSPTANYIETNKGDWKEEEAFLQIERFSKQDLTPYREWVGYKVRKKKSF